MGVVASTAAVAYTAVTTAAVATKAVVGAAATIATNETSKFAKRKLNGVSPENATFKHISSEYQKMFDKLVSWFEIINFTANKSNVVENNTILYFLNEVFIENLNILYENMNDSNTGTCRTSNYAYLERVKMTGDEFLKKKDENIETKKPTYFRDNECFKKFDKFDSDLKEIQGKLVKNITYVNNIHSTNSNTFDINSQYYKNIDINLYKMLDKFISMRQIFSDLLEYDIKYHKGEIEGTWKRRWSFGFVSWAANSGYSFNEVAEILERLKENAVDTLRNTITLNREMMNTCSDQITICLNDFKKINYIIKKGFNDKLLIKYYIGNNEETIDIDFGNFGLEHSWHSFANKFNDKIREINSNLETNYDIELIVVSTGDDNIVRYGLPQDDNNLLRFVFKSRNSFSISDVSTILSELGFQQQSYFCFEKRWEQEINQQSEIVTEYVIVSENNLNPDLGNLKMKSIDSTTKKINKILSIVASNLGRTTIERVNNLHSQAANQ